MLDHATIGEVNTETTPTSKRPRVHGGGVELGTGRVFCGTFTNRVLARHLTIDVVLIVD